MPLRGGECPLGKFELEPHAGAYTADPVEACLYCNFADTSPEGFDLEKICQCPADISWNEYDQLRKSYSLTSGDRTRQGFWEFVGKNYKSDAK